jgi:hypothetical protein
MMRRDGRNPFGAATVRERRDHRSLTVAALILALSVVAAEQRQEAVKTAPEPPPQQPPPNNWFNVSTPGVRALARPDSFLQYGLPPDGACCPGRRCGRYLRRIVAWATYFPKYRACSCCQWCNSCQYKGVAPLYLYFLNPKCSEGSGNQATFTNECYRGCKSCPADGHP